MLLHPVKSVEVVRGGEYLYYFLSFKSKNPSGLPNKNWITAPGYGSEKARYNVVLYIQMHFTNCWPLNKNYISDHIM